ncbi:MAG: PAS domain-containing protein [Leptospirales bacterium]|nr:PAS domain-containing protein [Leptospirales bacterium]
MIVSSAEKIWIETFISSKFSEPGGQTNRLTIRSSLKNQVSSVDSISKQTWQFGVVNGTSRIVFLGGTALAAILAVASKSVEPYLILTFLLLIAVGLGWLTKRSWQIQTYLLVIACSLICLSAVASLGPRFGPLTSGTIAACLAMTLLGLRQGVLVLVLLIAGLICVAYGALHGFLNAPSLAMPNESPALGWTRALVGFGVTTGAVAGICSAIVRALEANLEQANATSLHLKASEERYALAVQGSTDGIWDWDLANETISYGARFAELLSRTPSEMGNSVAELLKLVHPDDLARVQEVVRQHMAGNGKYDVHLRLMLPDKSYRWFRSRGEAIRDQNGHAVRMAGAITDINDNIALEMDRERLIRELENKNSELERFTYTVSHDLKSPIVTIKGFVGMLRQDLASGSTDNIQEDLNRIEGAADKMSGLLSDLLDLSRAGHALHPIELLEMRKVIDSTLELLAGGIKEHGIVVEVDEDIPQVSADPKRIAEVWQNLIENAIKYRNPLEKLPRIQIGCRNEANQLTFFVRDNGIGIDPKYREIIFGHFNQLNPAIEGSGIGLSIARRIVEGHGGKIWVESPPNGNGSVFCFTLPAGKGREN